MDLKEELAIYRRARELGLPLISRMTKELTEDEIGQAADALGMMHGKVIELETEDEVAVLMDFALHRRDVGDETVVERYARKHWEKESDEARLLIEAHTDDEFAMYEVREAKRGTGVVVRDMDEQERLVLDIGFSQTAVPGIMFAGRLITLDQGWWMTTGACLPLHESAMRELREHLLRDEAAGRPRSGAQIEPLVLRTCIRHGASRYIRYGEAAEQAKSSPPLAGMPKTGRNDPCPCGSGIKHKKCCGR